MGIKRKRVLMFALIILIFSSFSVYAQQNYSFLDETISLILKDTFAVIDSNNLSKNTAVIEEIGHSKKSIKKFMNDNGVVFIAVAEGNKHQLQLKEKTTQFSIGIDDMSFLSKDDVSLVAEGLSLKDWTNVDFNGTTYLCVKYNGEYSSTQYITIKNGSIFSFVYYGEDSSIVSQALSTLTFKTNGAVSVENSSVILETVINCGLILAALIAIGIIIFTFFKDKKHVTEDNDVREFIKIKRRKF